MKKYTCIACRAFSPLTKECRKHSPDGVVVQGPGGVASVMGVWPATSPDNWCCEFEPDASVIQ